MTHTSLKKLANLNLLENKSQLNRLLWNKALCQVPALPHVRNACLFLYKILSQRSMTIDRKNIKISLTSMDQGVMMFRQKKEIDHVLGNHKVHVITLCQDSCLQ